MNSQPCSIVWRRFLTSKVKPAVRIPNENLKANKPTNFTKNFPLNKKTKAWERAGEDKESWFKRKYAHVHAKQKSQPQVDLYGKKEAHYSRLKQDILSSKRQQEEHKSKYSRKSVTLGLRPNPLMEYIYGTNSVIAALNSDRREYFTRILYYNTLPPILHSLAKKHGLKLEEVDKHRLNLITDYGVHNNIVLETKPLQPSEITSLNMCDPETGIFHYSELDFDQNVTKTMKYLSNEKKKFPLGIYLDEVVDPHNIGAITRSAYFLGADFMVMSRKNCAPLSPVVSKTSSGAMELMPIFTTDKPLNFFTKSQEEGGWTFVTSSLTSKNSKHGNNKVLELKDLNGMVNELPVILVAGNEGNGVRTNLQMRSDFFVEIPFGRSAEESGVVDSLNVSVATALLLNSLLN